MLASMQPDASKASAKRGIRVKSCCSYMAVAAPTAIGVRPIAASNVLNAIRNQTLDKIRFHDSITKS
jgi:hypothetical protein